MGNKIQRIYVGSNQVRPNEYVYEFDFTDSTGWTLSNATISSNKLKPINDADGYGQYTTKDISTAKKIKMEMQCYGTTGSWVGIINAQWRPVNNSYGTGMIVNYMTSSGYNSSGLKVGNPTGYTQTYTISTTTKYGNGSVIPVVGEIDLVNKTAKFTMNNTVIGTATLTDTQINYLRESGATDFRITISKNSWYVSYLKLTVTY